MSFTVPQSADFFPLRDAAWREAARLRNLDPKDGSAKDEWYRETLETELGVTTSKALCPRNDYCAAMAVMENIARGSHVKSTVNGRRVRSFEPGRIYWNLRQTQDEGARRTLHAIRQLCRDHDIPEHYARGTAAAISGIPEPVLSHFNGDGLRKVLVALRLYVARHAEAEEPKMEGEPF
jgi:hypothetical protein